VAEFILLRLLRVQQVYRFKIAGVLLLGFCNAWSGESADAQIGVISQIWLEAQGILRGLAT
jgi:hypothetical protein